MKKSIFLLSFLGLSAIAQTKTNLVVWTKDGTQVAYALKDKPKVQFTETSMVISSNNLEVDYPLKDMKCFTYGTASTSVTNIHTNISPFKISGDCLLFSALQKNSNIAIYTSNGVPVLRKTVSQSGEYAFPLNELSNGVYIVNVNGITYKFVKR